MSPFQKVLLVGLRLALGWLYSYAGVTKLLDPSWSAAGYIQSANNFTGFFAWLLRPEVLPLVNALNAWGLTLIGLALIVGFGTRLAAAGGVVMMGLYYAVALDFPYPNEHSLLVDEHVIYSLVLMILVFFDAGSIGGLGSRCARWPLCRRYPWLHKFSK